MGIQVHFNVPFTDQSVETYTFQKGLIIGWKYVFKEGSSGRGVSLVGDLIFEVCDLLPLSFIFKQLHNLPSVCSAGCGSASEHYCLRPFAYVFSSTQPNSNVEFTDLLTNCSIISSLSYPPSFPIRILRVDIILPTNYASVAVTYKFDKSGIR